MTSSVCILTDSTVQFIHPSFKGHELVNIYTLPVSISKGEKNPSSNLLIESLPPSARNSFEPRLIIPTSEQFRQKYLDLSHSFNEIVVILHSSHISEAVMNAQEAADSVRGRISVQVIDSLSISVGLGYLIEAAASAAAENAPSTEIERLMRGLIPHIYSVFCIPGLTYLYYAGFLGKAQAVVGEMLGLLPIFSLEEGHITPVEKVRNSRHLIDFLQEFLDEFSDLDHISIIQSQPPMAHEIKTIREHAGLTFPHTPISEYPINLPLAALFGPRTLSVFAIEQVIGT